MKPQLVALLRATINLLCPTIAPKSRGDMAHAWVDRFAAHHGIAA